MHGVGILEEVTNDSVPGLVERDGALLLIRDEPALALWTGDHAIDRLLQVLHLDALLAEASSKQRSLVHEVT